MIGGRRPLQGRKPADRRVRVERPHAPFFRYIGPGTARRQAGRQRRPDPDGPVLRARPRRRLRAPAVDRGGDRRAPVARRKALAIFSSDAISSSAYATEEILRVLLLAGASALFLSIQVAIAITDPAGGRVRLVPPGLPRLPERRRRLHRGQAPTSRPIFGLIAAAALLIDYVMTVSVSTAAAIAQIQSVIPAAYDIRIEIAFVSISLITIANLRGLRESGQHLRRPDLPVRRPGTGDRRDRPRPHHRRDGRAGRPSRTPSRSRARSRRSASCSCSRPSPAVRSR